MEDIAAFVKKIENEFDELEKGTLTPQTNYREIENWSSMHALIIIALIDSEFDVLLNGDDLKETQTIQDLFNLVQSKTNNG
ncbi:MAG: acyl carrier protein [Vicingaceae bacterium]|nr:acyl carrier protein [Vicingaceae bacterium]